MAMCNGSTFSGYSDRLPKLLPNLVKHQQTMTSQPALFYQESFDQLLSELEETRDPSMQETHNLAIVKFLNSGENPLPALTPLIDQIRSESASEPWPTHPSWNLLNYHVCLYHFYAGNVPECRKVLDSLWKNSENMDKLLLICISLLSIELAIRHGDESNLEQAQDFLKKNCADEEATRAILHSKVDDEKWCQKILEQIRFKDLRLQVSRAVKMPGDSGKRILEEVLSSVKISTDAKSRTLLPVTQIIPIAQAALYLDDQYIPVLESSEDQLHFALLNNRGIFEVLQNRYSSALLHFSKALKARKGTMIVHPFQQVIYNIGLSLLMRKQPREAFQFLHSIIPMMSQSPYLWLRLAECCVMFYRQRVDQLRKEKQVSPVIAQKFSTSTRTFIVLPQTDYKLFEKYPLQGDGYVSDLNMDFAQKCTRNAIALCGDNPALEPLKRSAEHLCSFISLELGDGRMAAEMGKRVYTAVSSVADVQRQFYAKIYAAQGYIMTGDTGEAGKILSRLLIESNKELKESNKATLIHLLTFTSVGLASQDLKKAQQQLSRVPETDATRPEVILTRVAMELKSRNLPQALAALNSYSASP